MILIVSLTFFFYISFSIMLISVVGIYRSYWPSVISVLVMKCLLKPKVSSNYVVSHWTTMSQTACSS